MYLLFAGDCYYPKGGWADWRGTYQTLLEATTAAANLGTDGLEWWQIIEQYDDGTGQVVKEGGSSNGCSPVGG
jgi:hypothetical protein